MTLPMPLAPRSGKSVLAAVTDREPSTWSNKQWDSADPVGSTDFYFGSGESFRSGSAGGPGSIEEQRASGGAQKYSDGPSQLGFHRVLMGAQGTMGIFNWITIRLEILPTQFESFLVATSDLSSLIDYVYAVQRELLGEQSFILNKAALGLLMSKKDKNVFNEYQTALPDFICLQTIGGFDRLPKERLKYQKHDIQEMALSHNLKLESIISNLDASDLYDRATHSCGQQEWRDDLYGACCSIFFLTTLERVPTFINEFKTVLNGFNINDSEVGIYIQPMVQNHACHVEFMVPFDPSNSQRISEMRTFEEQAIKHLISKGAFFNRPYGTASELVWDQNLANTRLVEIVKNIFDPKGVLQKGKWFTEPKHFEKLTPHSHDLSELAKMVGDQWISSSPCLLDT